jgi:hypothetical protein
MQICLKNRNSYDLINLYYDILYRYYI